MEPGKYERLGTEIGRLVDEKNRAYGDAFNKSSDFLKIIYWGAKCDMENRPYAIKHVN
jgi:hypothetical protein